MNRKVLCLILALVMVFPLLASCNNGGGGNSNGDEIPADIKFPDYEFTVLVTGNSATMHNPFDDIAGTENEATLVEQAIYQRNRKIEEMYDIKLNVIFETKDQGASQGVGASRVITAQTAGDYDYDMCIVSGQDSGRLASQGYLSDLNNFKYINLENDYWDQSAVSDLKINNRVYITSGDINFVDDEYTFAMVFNKPMASEYGMENFYDLVNNGEWTFDKMSSFVKQVSDDINSDGVPDAGDKYGLLTWNDTMYAMFYATGEKQCTVNPETGKLELTIYNERTTNLVQKYLELCSDKQHVCNFQTVEGAKWADIYTSDRALFFMSTIFSINLSLRDTESDYGILPYPKLESTQDKYYSSMAPIQMCMFCIPALVEDEERTGIIVETLAKISKEIVTPAFYDKTVVGRGTRDEDSYKMLDVIFGSKVFDLGKIHRIGLYNGKLLAALREDGWSWTSTYESNREKALSDLEAINAQYSSVIENETASTETGETSAAQ